MSLALNDLPRDPEWLLLQLRHMTEVVAAERSRSAALEIERDTVLAERDAAQAEIERLRLLIRRLHRHVMSSTRIFADDTRLPVLDPGRGRTKTGCLWGYAIDDRPWQGGTPPAVVYLYAEDRKGEHPAAHLAEFEGVLQVDGYSGFKRLLAGRPPDQIKLAFCWAHCRRGFYELYRSTGSPLAEEALRRIGELYAIEAEVRGRPAEERRTVRQERSKPIVEALHAWLTVQLARVSGKSGLAEAIRYALRHWPGLVLFLEDGRIELDNNTVERAIRAFAGAGHDLPREAMRWALEHWDEAAPGLLGVLERYAYGTDRSEEAVGAAFFILHLAAERRG